MILCRRKLKRREVLFFLLYIFVPLGGGAAQMFTRGIAVVNISVSLALLFILVNIQFEHEMALREQERELAKQEKELTEQRINIMLSQIQPHFLYNSLGAIYQLCETDPALARTSIRKFSDFLRGNMDSLKASGPIPFEKELNHVMNFLYLEQQRFGEQLRVVYHIGISDFFIPPLTLQPLVENALQHGFHGYQKQVPCTISVQAWIDRACGMLHVRVTDNGKGITKEKLSVVLARMEMQGPLEDREHIALINISRRLRIAYAGRSSLRITTRVGCFTCVEIQIPVERMASLR